mmetsp:Transcript_41882/g.98178  ORF Transcript_41882/g.98178 Transcript_41882/m.98178 type:complete len:533 (+) Transcript_41882:89-1687(+)
MATLASAKGAPKPKKRPSADAASPSGNLQLRGRCIAAGGHAIVSAERSPLSPIAARAEPQDIRPPTGAAVRVSSSPALKARHEPLDLRKDSCEAKIDHGKAGKLNLAKAATPNAALHSERSSWEWAPATVAIRGEDGELMAIRPSGEKLLLEAAASSKLAEVILTEAMMADKTTTVATLRPEASSRHGMPERSKAPPFPSKATAKATPSSPCRRRDASGESAEAEHRQAAAQVPRRQGSESPLQRRGPRAAASPADSSPDKSRPATPLSRQSCHSNGASPSPGSVGLADPEPRTGRVRPGGAVRSASGGRSRPDVHEEPPRRASRAASQGESKDAAMDRRAGGVGAQRCGDPSQKSAPPQPAAKQSPASRRPGLPPTIGISSKTSTPAAAASSSRSHSAARQSAAMEVVEEGSETASSLDLSRVMRLPAAAATWAKENEESRDDVGSSEARTAEEALHLTTGSKEVQQVLRDALQAADHADQACSDEDLLKRVARLGAPWKGALLEFVKAAEGASESQQPTMKDLTRRIGDC